MSVTNHIIQSSQDRDHLQHKHDNGEDPEHDARRVQATRLEPVDAALVSVVQPPEQCGENVQAEAYGRGDNDLKRAQSMSVVLAELDSCDQEAHERGQGILEEVHAV